MQTKVEGLVLSKIPYDERHLIVNLLLRTGRKISVVFYGGRGGGKKQKSSIIELGFMLSVELSQAKTNTEVYHAKEWNMIWHHDLIRNNHNAFYLMCFFLFFIFLELFYNFFYNIESEYFINEFFSLSQSS